MNQKLRKLIQASKSFSEDEKTAILKEITTYDLQEINMAIRSFEWEKSERMRMQQEHEETINSLYSFIETRKKAIKKSSKSVMKKVEKHEKEEDLKNIEYKLKNL